jgi:Putative transposase/Transposase zinc-binding domain
MNKPPVEVADIIHAAGKDFIEKHRSWLTDLHRKVLSAIKRCRTAALGGHRDRCFRCGHTVAISYNSCRNRHCPKCLNNARKRWLSARQRELLDVPYVHLVFTIPHTLAPLLLHNKKLLYGLLFRTSAETLLEIARDPKHLGAEIGFFSVLHTWGQNLMHHPHIHCVIPAGGLSADHRGWIHPRYRFFLPRGVLADVFRGKFVDALKQAFCQDKLSLTGELQFLSDKKTFLEFLRTAYLHRWVVEVKPPFGGPDYVLKYLAHYTHRVAISNHRLVSLKEGKVTFRWKDYRDGGKHKLMTLTVDEFLRRFLLHTLPRGFIRIRFFGFMANRRRGNLLPICKSLLTADYQPLPPSETMQADKQPTWVCPLCGGPMMVIQRMTALQIIAESLEHGEHIDTS